MTIGLSPCFSSCSSAHFRLLAARSLPRAIIAFVREEGSRSSSGASAEVRSGPGSATLSPPRPGRAATVPPGRRARPPARSGRPARRRRNRPTATSASPSRGRGRQRRDPQLDAAGDELALEIAEPVDHRHRHQRQRRDVDHDDSRSGDVDGGEHLAVRGPHVGRVQGPVEAEHEQAGDGDGVAVDGTHVVDGGRGPQLGDAGAVELAQHEQQRQQHADEHGRQQAEHQPGPGRGHGDPELDAVQPPEPAQLGRLDQPQHRDHDHAAQGGLGEVAEHAAEEQRGRRRRGPRSPAR